MFAYDLINNVLSEMDCVPDAPRQQLIRDAQEAIARLVDLGSEAAVRLNVAELIQQRLAWHAHIVKP